MSEPYVRWACGLQSRPSASLFYSVLSGAPVLRRIFASPIARFVGLISYSFYLWHLVIMRALEPHLLFISSLGWRVLAAIVVDLLLSVMAAYLSYSLAERPFIAARRRAREQPVSRKQRHQSVNR